MAPSTLMGNAFFASAKDFSTARAAFMCTPSTPASRASSNNRAVPRILGVIAMTESRHPLARFPHRRECARGSFIH